MNFARPKSVSRVRRLVLSCAFVLVSVLITTVAQAQDRALIVAIDKYADNRLADLPANLAGNDVSVIEKLLKEKLGYKAEEIKVLHNEEATREAVIAAFEQWLYPEGNEKKEKKKSPGKAYRSYFYFSGLGYFQPDQGGEEDDRMDETLVPQDASLVTDSGPARITGMITDDDISGILRKFRNRHVTLVLDTSHSGVVTRSRNLAARPLTRMRVPAIDGVVRRITPEGLLSAHKREGAFVEADIPGGSLTVWSAVSPTQTALIAGEDDTPKGLFTLLYAEGIETGIADGNSNGIVSNAELLAHIVKSCSAYCIAFRERCEMGLRPRLDPPRAYGESAWVDRKKVTHRKERQLTIERLLDFVSGNGEAAIEIIQSPMSPVHVGAKDIRFYVKTLATGYIVLLNLTENGELFQLYPNQYSGNGAALEARLVQARTPLVVPEDSYGVKFNATVPVKGHIVAIVTPDPVRFDASVTDRVISLVSPDEAIDFYLARLSAALHAPIYQTMVEADTDTARWSVEVLPYEILP